MGYPTFLNVTEKTLVLVVACTVTSKWIVFGTSTLPATHAWPKLSLLFLGNVNELWGESLKPYSGFALYMEKSVLYIH